MTPSMYNFEGFRVDDPWLGLMDSVMRHGNHRQSRAGDTRSLFGTQLRTWAGLMGHFPAVTAKKLFVEQVWAELAAFIQGYETLDGFHSFGCKIWDANAMDQRWVENPHSRMGDRVGRIYGAQWRYWQSVYSVGSPSTVAAKVTDQLKDLVTSIRKDPYGRRQVVTAWNPGELDQMCLPPCHILFQTYCTDCEPAERRNGHDWAKYLHMRVDMRSVDLFLGLPFDIASYATLQALLAREVGMQPGELVFQMGDSHIYRNHDAQVRTVAGRRPFAPPKLVLADGMGLFDFDPAHASLAGYESHGAVAAPMNV
jgi:thymidylate synthase